MAEVSTWVSSAPAARNGRLLRPHLITRASRNYLTCFNGSWYGSDYLARQARSRIYRVRRHQDRPANCRARSGCEVNCKYLRLSLYGFLVGRCEQRRIATLPSCAGQTSCRISSVPLRLFHSNTGRLHTLPGQTYMLNTHRACFRSSPSSNPTKIYSLTEHRISTGYNFWHTL